jgi:hypothetical protein
MAVFNPIHYLELPELFTEFICSMTGKSPSTTGAGSEGRAHERPPSTPCRPSSTSTPPSSPTLLTGDSVFVTAAGYAGPHFRVDHDISLLVPEVFCRMSPEERDPKFLIANHYLEKCDDFESGGGKILASRLGWRINIRFVHAFFGRVFNHPHAVFTEEMLRPELQGMEIFADGMDNIITTQKRVAKMYFDDGSIAQACPPLQALLHIMLHDEWEGKKLGDVEFRKLFTRENLLASDWYAARLAAKQKIDKKLWRRHVEYLNQFLRKPNYEDIAENLGVADHLTRARKILSEIESPEYLKKLSGTLGAEPIGAYLTPS